MRSLNFPNYKMGAGPPTLQVRKAEITGQNSSTGPGAQGDPLHGTWNHAWILNIRTDVQGLHGVRGPAQVTCLFCALFP